MLAIRVGQVFSGEQVLPDAGVVLVLEFKRKAGLTTQARAQTVGQLHRAGMHLVSGSDGGITPGKRHGILPEAVSALVDGGASPTDALASATSLAAVACGVGDRKGLAKDCGRLRGWTAAAALCLIPRPMSSVADCQQNEAPRLSRADPTGVCGRQSRSRASATRRPLARSPASRASRAARWPSAPGNRPGHCRRRAAGSPP